jgi:hypothetical protein
MKAWLVYFIRLGAYRLGVMTPPNNYVGKRVIIGITFLDAEGALIERFQMHGRISRVCDTEGVAITRPDGGIYVVPPNLRNFAPARPGEYRLRSDGRVVHDPDYLTSFTMQGTRPENIEIYKTAGFIGPYRQQAS